MDEGFDGTAEILADEDKDDDSEDPDYIKFLPEQNAAEDLDNQG